MKTTFFVFVFFIFCLGCGQKEFTAQTSKDQTTAPQKSTYQMSVKITPKALRPKVDMIILLDNSTSQLPAWEYIKKPLTELVYKVSKDFSARIYMAPLLENNPEDIGELFSTTYPESRDSLPISLQDTWVTPEQLSQKSVNFVLSSQGLNSGSSENGLERATSLMAKLKGLNAFREFAYQIIVLISNGDDNSSGSGSNCRTISGRWVCFDTSGNPVNPVNDSINQLLNIRSSLNAKFLRMISIVGHSRECLPGTKQGNRYMEVSQKLYSQSYDPAYQAPTDQYSRETPDSYDFCEENFSGPFESINIALKKEMPYTFTAWPIMLSETPPELIQWDYNPEKVTVEKMLPGRSPERVDYNLSNGWSWATTSDNKPVWERDKNIWKCDNPLHHAECDQSNLSGIFIKLNGDAKLDWPGWIRISFRDQPSYYGYVRLDYQPCISAQCHFSIRKNGQLLNYTASDLKQKVRYFSTPKVIRIKNPEDFSQAQVLYPQTDRLPPGWYLRLKKEHVYTNRDVIDLNYHPNSWKE